RFSQGWQDERWLISLRLNADGSLACDSRDERRSRGRSAARDSNSGRITGNRVMARTVLMGGVCLLALSVVPAFAQTTSTAAVHAAPTPIRTAPAPKADVGLISLVMVGTAALAIYWRKRNS